MKPKPTSSMQRADRARGSRSISTPSASSTSARAAARVARAVAVLGDRAAGAGRDQRRGGRDVEGGAPAAGAAGVDQVVARASRRRRASARIVRGQAGELGNGLALGAQRDQEARVWTGSPRPSMISVEHRARPVAAEVLAGAGVASIARVRMASHHAAHAPRKFASSRLPAAVRTDSGWNCTPSAGSSRWRTPMTTSPSHRRRPRARRAGRGRRQRVVAADGQRARRAREDRPAVVLDLAGLAVHRLVPRTTLPPKACAERLVAEADAEHRDPAGEARGSPRPRCPPRPASRARARPPGGSALARRGSSTVDVSLRTTTSAPSSPRYWTRL